MRGHEGAVDAGSATALPAWASAKPLLASWSWAARLRTAIAVLALCCVWARYMVAPAAPGRARLLRAVPCLALLFAAPLLFSPATELFSVLAVAYLSERMPATKVRWG